jgi:hypothetical protein
MKELWENHKKFVDEIGTTFTKLSEEEYEFITKEGDEDICSKKQIKSWNIKLSTVLK